MSIKAHVDEPETAKGLGSQASPQGQSQRPPLGPPQGPPLGPPAFFTTEPRQSPAAEAAAAALSTRAISRAIVTGTVRVASPLTTESIDRPLTRAERLKKATQSFHEMVEASFITRNPFADRDRYADLVEIQYRFMAAIEPLYRDADLAELLPGLPQRSRLESAKRDLGDLGRPAPEVVPLPMAGKACLGWLYVSEGSTLGAAFLLAAVEEIGLSQTFGGRHLAPAPEGRGRRWRDFKEMLNAVPLDACEEEQVVAGALAAFAHVQALVGGQRAA